MPAIDQKFKDPGDKITMIGPGHFAKIRDLAQIPEQTHPPRIAHLIDDRGCRGQCAQGGQIIGLARADQALIFRHLFERCNKRVEAAEIQARIAPMQLLDRGKAAVFDGGDQRIFQRLHITGHPETAIGAIAPGPPGNLAQLMGHQFAHPAAIEFRIPRKGHMGNIEIQPHADRVGCDEVIDVAVLVQFHLGIPGPGRQRAHDHRSAAL